MQTIDTARVTNALPTTGIYPPSEKAMARWNSVGQSLQTRPAGNAFTVLLTTLRNDTAHAATSVWVSYFLDITPGSLGIAPIPGQHVYFSLTGALGDWCLVPEFSRATSGSVRAELNLGSWPSGGLLYLLSADDK